MESFDIFLKEKIKEAVKEQPEIDYKDLNIRKIKGNLYIELMRHIDDYPSHYREVILSSI